MSSQTVFVPLDYRFDDPRHDQPINACNVCRYHLLICGHTIRTPLVDNCGHNCVDALPACLEYPAFACSKCHEDKIERIEIAFSTRTKTLINKIAKDGETLDPWKLDELAREWDERLAEAQREFDGKRNCEVVVVGNARECGDNVDVVGLKSVRRSARNLDRKSKKADPRDLHNLLSGLSISNGADLDLAEVLSRLKISTQGSRGRGVTSTGRDRSRSPTRETSTSIRRYRERSVPRGAAKPCRATPAVSAIMPSRAWDSQTENLLWQTPATEYLSDTPRYPNGVAYDSAAEKRVFVTTTHQPSSTKSVSKAFGVWAGLVDGLPAQNPASKPTPKAEPPWVRDAEDMRLGHSEHELASKPSCAGNHTYPFCSCPVCWDTDKTYGFVNEPWNRYDGVPETIHQTEPTGDPLEALTALITKLTKEDAAKRTSQEPQGVEPLPRPKADAEDMLLSSIEHLAIDGPQLVEAESDSSIGPWLATSHGQNDVSENHPYWRNESSLLPMERRGAVDFGRLGKGKMREAEGETWRIPGLATGMEAEEGNEEVL